MFNFALAERIGQIEWTQRGIHAPCVVRLTPKRRLVVPHRLIR